MGLGQWQLHLLYVKMYCFMSSGSILTFKLFSSFAVPFSSVVKLINNHLKADLIIIIINDYATPGVVHEVCRLLL